MTEIKIHDDGISFLNYKIEFENRKKCCEIAGWFFVNDNRECKICNNTKCVILKPPTITDENFDLISWLKQDICPKYKEDQDIEGGVWDENYEIFTEYPKTECDNHFDNLNITISETNIDFDYNCCNIFHHYYKPCVSHYHDFWKEIAFRSELGFNKLKKYCYSPSLRSVKVTISTNLGNLYFIAYNIQTGYYDHNITIYKDGNPIQNLTI